MLYTVGEVAERVGISAHTLRYYDREGLLPFVERSASGIRMFKEHDFEWLHLIECLKSSGMPLREIKQFIDWYTVGDETLEQRRDMFYARKEIVEEQIKELNKTLDMLTYKCWFYDTAVEAGTVDAPKQLNPEALPEKIAAAKARAFDNKFMRASGGGKR
ncbi:MerR family transcriptional regulator [Ruminococcaceae bacterium OttesenSCG-928-L11]|nr:MerR family transcriptional regulator [Ruminococcaceae bacterium OttesenSCG-928-L11]